MKKNHVRIWKFIVAFCLTTVISTSVFAVNLVVSGFPAPYTAANGVYIPTAQVNSHDCWVHSSGGYYIYFHAACADWEIYNVNTENDCSSSYNYYAYSSNAPSPVGLSWTRNLNLMAAGSITVTEESAPPVPEMDITGNGNIIADGNTWTAISNHTKFVSADISTGTSTRTYTIYNNGTAALTVTNPIVISGTNAADFSITTPPASSIATGSSTTFTISYNPSAIGIKTATITITNSDENEGTYDFAIDGYGYSPQNLVVTGIITPAAANTTYIHQGVLNNYEYWLSSNGYYLYTDGSFWYIDNNTVSTIADGVDFFSNCSFNPSILDATVWSGAPATGTRGTGTPVISAAAPTSNINVKGNSINIAINDNTPSFSDNTKYGSVNISGGSRARTYTIENTGGAALTLSAITFGGAGAPDFSVTTPPSASVAAFSSTTFTVTFDPTTEGTKTATLSIPSNDPDENPYPFYISGDAFSQKNLLVSGITTPAAANGGYTYQGILHEFQYWKHVTLNYFIYNSIYSNTNYWYIDIDTVSVGLSDFLFGKISEDVAPVGLSGWVTGTGADGVPVIVYASPEMDVTGNSTSIADGDVTPSTADYTDFGVTTVASGTISHTFTINNTGNEILNLSGTPIIAKSGTNAADFTITQPSSASLAALTGTITFTVEFNPSGAGLRTAELSIANNDSDENPYNFSIQGTGIDIPAVITTAASSITTTAATLGGNVTSDGGATVSEHGVVYSLTDATPTIAEGATKVAIGSGGTGIFSQSVASLTSNTLYYYNAYAINTAGTSYGTEVSFTTSAIAPTVTTQAVSSITATTATGNGNITSLGVPNPTAHGVCWNTTGTPTTTDAVEDNGAASATGAYTASMTSLTANTTYFVRAFATNTAGTSYGTEVSFTTSAIAPTVTTQAVSGITATTATGNGNITTLGVPNPSAHGVCWNTTGTPTTADVVADNSAASATGAFTASMTSLTANTTYYVRAFATNTAGTSYGTEVSFTTAAIAPTVTTQAVSGITANTVTGNGNITSLGVPNPTAHGFCWNTTGTPTTADFVADNGSVSVTGAYTSSIIGLTASTTYYVRAFATNIAGTSYGAEEIFTTPTPSIAFNIASSNGLESANSANLQVDLSDISGLDVTVDYTVTGTATGSGTDYTLANGTLTITAGNPSNDITIAGIVDDLLDETDETVIVTLSNPVNATLGTNTAHTYTITDDDATPSIAFNTTGSNGIESISSADLQVDLLATSGLDVTIDYTVTGTASGSGTDYTLANGTLTITAGNTSNDITIAGIVDDLLDETDETVIVTLSNPVNATLGTNTVHTYTITDDDATPTIAFNTTGSNGLESISSADLQVDLLATSGLDVTVDYVITGTATGSGTDYTLANGTLTITAGNTSNDITIAGIVDDLLDETDETVIVTLSNPVNATLGTNTAHTFTITDDDATPTIAFNTTGSNGIESISSADLQVDLLATSGLDVTIDYTVTGTASGSGTDYTLANGTLTITAGNTSNDITIAGIVDDLLDETDETVIVTLSNPVNATLGTNTAHTYTITDDDATPSIAFNTTGSNGIESISSADLQVDLLATSSLDVTVDYTVTGTATGSGTDYTLANGTLTITAGNTGNDITIAGIVDDLLDETDETVIVTLSNPVNATLGTNTAHTFTITDDDATPTIAFNTTGSNGIESISSADLQVDLLATSGLDVTVDYTVTGTASGSGTDYTLANGTLTITAGNTGNNITIAGIVDDLLDETDETVIVTLSNPVNATLGTNTEHTYIIVDDDDVTNVFEISKSNISVYPNPFTNTIHFDNISDDIALIIISDLSGKTVLKADYKGEKEINVAHLTPGVYLLSFVNYDGEKQMIKIVKE